MTHAKKATEQAFAGRNTFYEQAADLAQDDIFTLAGFTMAGPGLGKAVRERFVAIAADLLRKHGPRAFEVRQTVGRGAR